MVLRTKKMYTLSSAAAIGSVLLLSGASNVSAMSANSVVSQNTNWVHMGSISQSWSADDSYTNGNSIGAPSVGVTGPRSYNSVSSSNNQSTNVLNNTTVNTSTTTNQTANGGGSQSDGNTVSGSGTEWTNNTVNNPAADVDGSALSTEIQNEVQSMLNRYGLGSANAGQTGGDAMNNASSMTTVTVTN